MSEKTLRSITEGISIEDQETMKRALEEAKTIPEYEIHYYLVKRDTWGPGSMPSRTQECISLAQVEWERRKDAHTKQLTLASTVVSGAIGLVGVLLGALLAG